MGETGDERERMFRRRAHRRVTTPPAPGSDPAPALPSRAEEHEDSNDERLRRDVPPHW